jgi:hypothetical protein
MKDSGSALRDCLRIFSDLTDGWDTLDDLVVTAELLGFPPMSLAPQRARQWSGLISEDTGSYFFSSRGPNEKTGAPVIFLRSKLKDIHGFVATIVLGEGDASLHTTGTCGTYRHETRTSQMHDQAWRR